MEPITRILHIGSAEDYRQIGELLSDVHHRDYQLIGSEGVDNLLGEILSQRYDVILLDYHWGGTQAKELLSGAIAQGCTAPVLVMTNEIEADVDREAIKLGASDYLIKGRIDSQLLERTVRYAIDRKIAESKLARLAHYDPLTNIPNRTLFKDRLEHALHLAERGQLAFTLMFLDLNGFKQVNDKFGHEVGDKLLVSCADRLCECMRKSDSVARIGGDEFTLLLEHPISSADIARIAEKIIASIEAPHQINGLNILIGCSIGIAVYPDAGRDADLLQRNADMAMYRAKQEAGSHYRFFTEAMNVEARKQILLESDLYRAVEHQEFSLSYLPRINLIDKAIVAYDAQLRWYHPVRGWLDADQYAQQAESTGLVVPLGHMAFQQLCKDLHALLNEDLAVPAVSIALSHRHLTDYKLLKEIREQAACLGPQQQQIEFTIAEAIAIENAELVKDFCKSLKQCGFSLALTNFGESLSDLRLLRSLPIQRIELAASVTHQYHSTADQEMITLLVEIAHKLGLVVSATDIKTAEQAEVLARLGCTLVSGAHIHQPLTAQQLQRHREPVLVG